jgi:predicted transcriptional regulator
MSVKELEARLNRRLREIREGYAVRHLKRLKSGEYWFDLALGFNAKDMAQVNRVFTEVLGTGARALRPAVQAKFYLKPETVERLKKKAARQGVAQSTLVEEALEIQQVDTLGLDELDRAFLAALIKVYNGGPAGIEAIAATMGQERDTLEDMVEPFLLQIGFVIRTRQGRQATKFAYDHLGLAFHPSTDGRSAAQPADEATLF